MSGHPAAGGGDARPHFPAAVRALALRVLGHTTAGHTTENIAALHDSLREQMWSHYKDSIGNEMFTHPENVMALLHDDWTANWIPSRLAKVKQSKKS